MSNQHIEMLTFAIIDKTRSASGENEEGELVGMLSFMNTSTMQLSTEIGFVDIRRQRHKVTGLQGIIL
jgi:hypothetical protein